MADKRVTTLAKNMRHHMTRYEYRLYADFLSQLPVRVIRQQVIGSYIADFYIPSSRMIIEVDGGQHFEAKAMARDAERDSYLTSHGYRVVHYTNNDIYTNLPGVAEDILIKLGLDDAI